MKSLEIDAPLGMAWFLMAFSVIFAYKFKFYTEISNTLNWLKAASKD